MQKVFMRFNSAPTGELGKAVQWFSDTYLKESYHKPSAWKAPTECTAIRTAPDRDSTRTKWWWTDEELLAELEGFAEVFYSNIGEL
jgi:hypothetical protein